MSAVRLLRITALAVVLPVLFEISQRVSAARGVEPVPGISWALGVVSVLFLARAVASESSLGPEANLQKDILWGLTAGGIGTIVWRLL